MNQLTTTTISLSTLEAAQRAWENMAELRRRRERFKRYTYGDQWSDLAPGRRDGLTEGDVIALSGRQPLTNNLIRQLVKTVVGRYRSISDERGLYSGSKAAERNHLSEIDCRMLEEFLISGCAVQRVVRERRPMGRGVWVDNVNPRDFFAYPLKDPRGWDTELVGMVHDMSMAEVINRFGRGDRMRAEALRRLYGRENAERLGPGGGGGDFFSAADGKCRVIEVWTLDCSEQMRCHDPENGRVFTMSCEHRDELDRHNMERHSQGRGAVRVSYGMGLGWRCRFLAPGGELLGEMGSPFGHGGHPFAMKFYPLTDGEVHPFVEDVIDQQRYINRLIVVMDHAMSVSAKGVLLFPSDQLLPDMTWEDVSRNWSTPGGVIPISGRGVTLPQQITTGGGDTPASQLLALQLKLFNDVSGVSDVLTGRGVSGTTGATMYEAQLRNATIALSDVLETFIAFTGVRDRLVEGS